MNNSIAFRSGPFKGKEGEVLQQYPNGMFHVLVYGKIEVEATVPEEHFDYTGYGDVDNFWDDFS